MRSRWGEFVHSLWTFLIPDVHMRLCSCVLLLSYSVQEPVYRAALSGFGLSVYQKPFLIGELMTQEHTCLPVFKGSHRVFMRRPKRKKKESSETNSVGGK